MKTRTNVRKNESAATTEATTTEQPTENTTTAPAATEQQPAAAASAESTETTPNTPSMDELAARVAEAEKGLTATHKTFTAAEFASYVNEQLEKAKGEDATKATARVKALQAAIALAKTAFEQGASASLPVYHDPWQEDPTTKSVSSPTGVSSGTSNIGYPTNVDTAKRMLVIAKELRTEGSPLAKALEAKVAKAVDFAPVAKAGEAAGLLEKIAGLFGVKATNDAGDYRGLGWRVEDVICALESAARMDKALAAMSAAFGGLAMPDAGAAPAPSDAQMAAKAALAKAAADDGDFSVRVGAITNGDGWPVDMNASPRVTKAVAKPADEEIRF